MINMTSSSSFSLIVQIDSFFYANPHIGYIIVIHGNIPLDSSTFTSLEQAPESVKQPLEVASFVSQPIDQLEKKKGSYW